MAIELETEMEMKMEMEMTMSRKAAKLEKSRGQTTRGGNSGNQWELFVVVGDQVGKGERRERKK